MASPFGVSFCVLLRKMLSFLRLVQELEPKRSEWNDMQKDCYSRDALVSKVVEKE